MADDRKTKPTDTDVNEVLAACPIERRRNDAHTALTMMREVTGAEPVVWGDSIIGFGRQPYTTADGKEREWFAFGLAARRAALTLYGLTYYGSNADLLERLGTHRTGKGCLYITNLAKVDGVVLRELITLAWATNHQP